MKFEYLERSEVKPYRKMESDERVTNSISTSNISLWWMVQSTKVVDLLCFGSSANAYIFSILLCSSHWLCNTRTTYIGISCAPFLASYSVHLPKQFSSYFSRPTQPNTALVTQQCYKYNHKVILHMFQFKWPFLAVFLLWSVFHLATIKTTKLTNENGRCLVAHSYSQPFPVTFSIMFNLSAVKCMWRCFTLANGFGFQALRSCSPKHWKWLFHECWRLLRKTVYFGGNARF